MSAQGLPTMSSCLSRRLGTCTPRLDVRDSEEGDSDEDEDDDDEGMAEAGFVTRANLGAMADADPGIRAVSFGDEYDSDEDGRGLMPPERWRGPPARRGARGQQVRAHACSEKSVGPVSCSVESARAPSRCARMRRETVSGPV